jgi:hypothetical protein
MMARNKSTTTTYLADMDKICRDGIQAASDIFADFALGKIRVAQCSQRNRRNQETMEKKLSELAAAAKAGQ